MASTYSTNLKLELIGTGDQSGTWGATTNTNMGTLIEQAIAGYATQAVTDSGVATVLTIPDGASSTGRNYVIELTGALTAARTVEVPAVNKPYVFFNNTTGGYAVTVKVTGQTGVVIANGKKAIVYTNSTDVIEVANAPATEAGTQTLTNKTLTTPVINGFSGSTAAITIGTTQFVKDTSGNIGIGTASPAVKLDVNGTIRSKTSTGGIVNMDSTTAGTTNTLGSYTNAGASFADINYSAADHIWLGSGTERMRLTSTGNVGIGTASPAYKLHVYGGSGASVVYSSATAGQVAYVSVAGNGNTFGSTSFDMIQNDTSTFLYNRANTPMVFGVNNAEAMRIASSGNLLVGTTSDQNCAITTVGQSKNPLGVFATGSNDCIFVVGNTTGSSSTAFYPMPIRNGSTSTVVGGIYFNGTITVYNTSSDYRLKKDVAPLAGGLSRVNALKPSSYTWIEQNLPGEGFIAHELQEVIPHAVTGEKDAVNEDGSVNPQQIDMTHIVPHLVAACQELSAKNDALEAANAAFEARLAKLENVQ